MNEEFLWVEKYRPHTIVDTILPSNLKKTFQQFVDDKNIPNLLLTGGAGVGKTTVARAMIEELGADYLVINGSLEGRQIETLRDTIANFATSVSLNGGRKYVILDEADYLNPNTVQPALRNFMEENSANCGFILTCNFKNKIISPLHSRCAVIDFKLPKAERADIAKTFIVRVKQILTQEGVKFDSAVIGEVLRRYFPDWRRVLNELQRYSVTGSIDTGMLAANSDSAIDQLIDFIKDRNFSSARKWIGENSDISTDEIFAGLYNAINTRVEKESIPELVLILAEYQYKSAFVVNAEINLAACIAQIMGSVNFK